MVPDDQKQAKWQVMHAVMNHYNLMGQDSYKWQETFLRTIHFRKNTCLRQQNVICNCARFRKSCSLSEGNTVQKYSSFTFPFPFFCYSVFSFRNLAPSTMTAAHPLLPHLKAISKEPPSCTLLTLEGGRVEVATHISHLRRFSNGITLPEVMPIVLTRMELGPLNSL